MNRIVLLRHGRTRYNAEARLQGQVDSELDEVGVAQATAAGKWIRARFDVTDVVTSPLRRTRQTVEAAGLDRFPVRLDERWREIDFGDYDTRPIAGVIEDLSRAWAADIDHVPDNGESMAALHRRVGTAWAEILADLAEGQGRTTVVVGHATPIKSALIHALDGTAAQILRMWIGIASISAVRQADDGSLVVEQINDLGHVG
ncbi:MAG: histidine phosphatase family protein [Acidimicrobiales bacterium]